MDAFDKKLLANMVRNNPINDLLDALQEAIDNRSNELVDAEMKDEAKPLTLVAHHLSIFPRG